VSPSLHLKKETDPVSETFWFLAFEITNERQSPEFGIYLCKVIILVLNEHLYCINAVYFKDYVIRLLNINKKKRVCLKQMPEV
jgi:hypothetical protein